jgi:hypothetical protein
VWRQCHADRGPALPEVALVPAAAGSDVDLLFVISNLEGAGEYGPKRERGLSRLRRGPERAAGRAAEPARRGHQLGSRHELDRRSHAGAGGRELPGAALAVVFVADEDDCSLAHGELTTSDTSVLGPLQSFRCTRYGVTCLVGGNTPDEMNAAGPKSGCHANDGSPYLVPLGEPQHVLEGAVPDARDVLVAGIIGNPTPVDVELRSPQPSAQPVPAVSPSCTFGDASGATVAAATGIRLADFIGRFRHHVVASECTVNFSPALDQIALQVGNLLGDPCVPVAVRRPAR